MKTCCWVICALAACGHQALPAPDLPNLLVATAPASAADCPFGGEVVSAGADANGNGILDDGEVASRTVVCNNAPAPPPPPTVVRLVAEPAGPHCALDGTAVQSGPDRNGNGVLDDDEVTHIDYVCGEPLLTRLAAAQPDATCAAGGVAFLVGRDRNHDGRLEDDEVEQREVACGDEVTRDVAVHDATEAAALAGIAVITGSLAVDGTALSELALPRLVQVRGRVEVKGNAALVRIALPALQSIDGPLALARDPALTELDLPVLRRVGGIVIDGDPALGDLGGLAALTEVAGDLQITNNDALASIDLPLERVHGGLTIDGNARLTRVAAALSGTLGAVHVVSNAQLASIALGGGATGRLAAIGDVAIAANHALGGIALDADVITQLFVFDSPLLTELAVTGERIAGEVQVVGIGPARVAFSARTADAFTIGGSLLMSGPITAITGSRPLVVTNNCTIDRSWLTAFGPDQVSRVGGGLTLSDNPRLTTISTIAQVGALTVSGNHALTNLAFDAGDSLGALTIQNNAILEVAPFDRLRRASYITIDSNPALKVFSQSLEEVFGALLIERNDSLTDLGLTHLSHAGGLGISQCNSLTEIDLPALAVVNIFHVSILANAQLQHLRFPLLRSADFWIFSNPRLPACEVTAMFAVIGGLDHEQRFNDDTAVCTP